MKSSSTRQANRYSLPPSIPNQKRPPSSKAPLQSLLQELRERSRGPTFLTMAGANLESAVEALWLNRTRSALTVLGIFIGVGAVVAALTLTQGVSMYVSNQFTSLGNSITISPGAANSSSGISQGTGTVSTLTTRDASAMESISHVTSVSSFIITNDQVVYGKENWTTQIEGVNANLQSIQNWTVAQGAWFTSTADTNGTEVAVLGDTVLHNLFDASDNNPIGQSIRIRDQVFRIVGVLAPQGGSFSQDDVVYIPMKAAQVRLRNTTYVDQIQVQVDSTQNVNQVSQTISATIRKNHHIQNAMDDDFSLFTYTQALQQVSQVEIILTALLVGIAAISLTVGGIGIMNIMLVSVTERTWEIGIRMAIGAHRRDIRNQFLIESVILCLLGGVIGLAVGLLLGWLITRATSLPFVVSMVTIGVPFVVSSAIALLFGLYPAIRASRLDPIVAIRSEE